MAGQDSSITKQEAFGRQEREGEKKKRESEVQGMGQAPTLMPGDPKGSPAPPQ